MGKPDTFDTEHEINTRLTRIRIAGQMLLRRGNLDDDQMRWVDHILQSTRELEGIRDALVARSHPGSDR